MTMSSNWLGLASASLALALAACGGGGGGETSSEGAAATAGGEPAIVITDQTEWDSLASAGKSTFDVACGACHPGGEADLGPALKGHMVTTANMTKQIREGSGRMKPIDEAHLPEDQMRGLMVYLATLGAVGDVKGP
jgi:mono/diheme cytochrome c family protein